MTHYNEVGKSETQVGFMIVTYPMLIKEDCLPKWPEGHVVLDFETESIKINGKEDHKVRIAGIGYRARSNNYFGGYYIGNYIGIFNVSTCITEDIEKKFLNFIREVLGNVQPHAWNYKFDKGLLSKYVEFRKFVGELQREKGEKLEEYVSDKELYENKKIMFKRLDISGKPVEEVVKWAREEVGLSEDCKKKLEEKLRNELKKKEDEKIEWGLLVGVLLRIFPHLDIDLDTRISIYAVATWKNGYDLVAESYRLLEKVRNGEVEPFKNAQPSQLLELLAERPNAIIIFFDGCELECRVNEKFIEFFKEYIPEIEEYSKQTIETLSNNYLTFIVNRLLR